MEDNQAHPGVTWDSNKSSSHCSICNKQFGRILQRRHHCRYCGRLVCASCSTNRAMLPNSIASSSGNTSGSGKDKDNKDDSLVRVCDPCFRVLTVKKAKLTEQKLQKEKKSELLRVTSFVSKSLLDVFFLDGNCKSLSYDETTTVDQLLSNLLGGSNSANFVLKLGLFEVKQDINNGDEYALLPFSAIVADIFTTWRDRSSDKYRPYGKLVLPIESDSILYQLTQNQQQIATHYSGVAAVALHSHPNPAASRRASFGLVGEEAAVGSDGGELSDEVFVLRNKLEDSQKEIERLSGLLDKTQRRLEVCKGVLVRSKKNEEWLAESSLPASAPAPATTAGATTPTPSTTSPGGEGPVEEGSSSHSKTGKGAARRESWYNPFKASSKKTSSSSAGAAMPSTPLPAQTADDETLSSCDQVSTPVRTSQSASENYYVEERQMYGTDNSLVQSAGKGFALHAIEEDILSTPARYLLKSPNEQAQFTRTFFHHVDSLEIFLSRYALFFQTVQPALYSQYQQENSRVSGLAESLASVYHMGVALDTLYVRSLALSETTRPALRAWLLQLFPVVTRLPVIDGETVTRLVRCLAKEDVLYSSGVQAVLHRQIELACLYRLVYDNHSQCVRLLYEEEEDGNHISWDAGNGEEEAGPVVSPGKKLSAMIHFVTKHTTSATPPHSGAPLPALSFPVMNQLMTNIINTFCYVLSDYANLLPPQYNLVYQYFVTSFTCFNQLIKPQYRYAVGNSTITLTEAYAIFLFLRQHLRQLDSLDSTAQAGSRATGSVNTTEDKYRVQIVENLRVKKHELRNICLFALKTEWERLVKERLGLSGKKAQSQPGGSGTGLGADGGYGLDLVNPVEYYGSFLGSGSSGYETGDGPVFPLCRWVAEVMQFLENLTGVFSRTNLFQDANQDAPGNGGLFDDNESGSGSRGDENEDDEVLRALRLSLLCALFDHLHSLAPVLEEQFVAAFASASNAFTPIDKVTSATGHHIVLLGEVNSCLVFLMQLTEYYLSLTLSPVLSCSATTSGNSSTTSSSTPTTSPLEEKYLAICDQFHSLVLRLVGLHCNYQWKHDLVSVLESGGLLRKGSNWEQDMAAVVQAKKLHRVYVNLVAQYVLSEDYVCSASWSTGLLAESGGQCLLPGFLQLVASVRLQYLALSTSTLVNHYLEALLTSQYCLPTATSSSVMNVTAFNARLMEDLQMIAAFVEEARLALFPAHAPHIIRTTADPSSKPRKLLAFGRKQQSNNNDSTTASVTPSSTTSWLTSQPASISSVLESKEVLEDYLSPLTHVICALNLSRRDLVAFTQQELYVDFGYQNALRLWQILLAWRQEKKEHIQQDYDNYFKAWLPPVVPQHTDKIKYSLPFLAKLKIANVVKLSSTNALLTGGFPSGGNHNNNTTNEWDSSNELSGSFRGSFAMSTSSFRNA